MKLYVAICEEYDPESRCQEYCPPRKEILGIFSTAELAKEAFTRKEQRQNGKDSWVSEHICFRGDHTVEEYNLDDWNRGPKTIFHQSLDRYGKPKKDWVSY